MALGAVRSAGREMNTQLVTCCIDAREIGAPRMLTSQIIRYVEPLFVWVGLQRRLSLRLILSSSGLSWGRTWAGLALQSII